MTLLFVMRHPGYIRNYESTLQLLAERGHHVVVAYERYRNRLGEQQQMDRLGRAGIVFEELPRREQGNWVNLLTICRMLLDYLRYLEPQFERAVELRLRIERTLPAIATGGLRAIASLGAWARRSLAAVLRSIDRAAPLSPVVLAYLRTLRADAVLVTPLVDFGSDQLDYVKCAAALGIPSGLPVASWDNLTNKGSMRLVPDRVFVWNAMQREEAVTLHRAPSDSVIVTGAQLFDHWFGWHSARSRDEFCAAVGLDPARPFVLYLGSSFFIAPDEAGFAERWIRQMRADEALRDVGVLVRPHPTNMQQWLAYDLSALGNVAVWPRLGTAPYSAEFMADFYDSLAFSELAVGVNTTAMIEAAIVGRPVCTMRAAEFKHSQEGTLHFQHLVSANGGLVTVADSIEENLAHIKATLGDRAAAGGRSRRFVEAFVRPAGLEVPATPVLVGAMEQMHGLAVAARLRPPWWRHAVRVLAAPAALLLGVLWRVEAPETPSRTSLLSVLVRLGFAVVIWPLAAAYALADAVAPATKAIGSARRGAARRAGRTFRHAGKRTGKARLTAASAVRGVVRGMERRSRQVFKRIRRLMKSPGKLMRRLIGAMR